MNWAVHPNFTVKRLNRHQLNYSEDNYELILEIEDLMEPYVLQIYSNYSFRWSAPHEKEEITAEGKEQIKKNIKDALSFLNIPSEFD